MHFSGALKRETCESVHLNLLRKYKLPSTKMICSCECGAEQTSLSDDSDSLLVVRSPLLLVDLNTALEPHTEETQTGEDLALNIKDVSTFSH